MRIQIFENDRSVLVLLFDTTIRGNPRAGVDSGCRLIIASRTNPSLITKTTYLGSLKQLQPHPLKPFFLALALYLLVT